MEGLEKKLNSEIESTMIGLLKGGFHLFLNVVRVNFLDNLSNAVPNYIKYVGEVKTIESQDNQLLTDIYFPLKVRGQNTNFHWKVEAVDELMEHSNNNFNLIEATAGHGKSFLLRYICCQEMLRGKYFPIFITLNRIPPSTKLIDYIADELNTLGFKFTKDLLISYFKKNRFALFFDGFDEIPNDQQKSIYEQMEKIARKNKKTPVIVTSRPDLSIGRSNSIFTFKIGDLEKEDQINFLKKMAGKDHRISHLIQSFSDKTELHPITKTPLLLTLLWIAYKYEQIIPASAIEFYDLLLPTFLYKHDNMKLSFNRNKRTQVKRVELKLIIEAFAFLAFSKGDYNPTSMRFSELLDESLSLVTTNISSEILDDLRLDIVEVTCLIIKDGYDRFKFIHLTVLEYFTACFISNLTDNKISELFIQLQKLKSQQDNEFNKWSMVLEFLSELKTGLYIEHYYYPPIAKLLGSDILFNKQEIADLLRNEDGESLTGKFNFSGELISINIPKGKLAGLPSKLEKKLYSVLFQYFQKLDISKIEVFVQKQYPDNTTRIVDLRTVIDSYPTGILEDFVAYFNTNFMGTLKEEYDYCQSQMNIKNQKSVIDILSTSRE